MAKNDEVMGYRNSLSFAVEALRVMAERCKGKHRKQCEQAAEALHLHREAIRRADQYHRARVKAKASPPEEKPR